MKQSATLTILLLFLLVGARPAAAARVFSNTHYAVDFADGRVIFCAADGTPLASFAGFTFMCGTNGVHGVATVTNIVRTGGSSTLFACRSSLPGIETKIEGTFGSRALELHLGFTPPKGTPVPDRRLSFPVTPAGGAALAAVPVLLPEFRLERDRVDARPFGALAFADTPAGTVWVRRHNGPGRTDDLSPESSATHEWFGHYLAEITLLAQPRDVRPSAIRGILTERPELDITTEYPGNVCTSAAPAAFSVTVGNTDPSRARAATVTVTARDYDGRAVLSNVFTVASLASGAAVTRQFALPAAERAFYVAEARAHVDGSRGDAYARASVAVMRPPVLRAPARIGVALHYRLPRPADEAALAGLVAAAGARFFDGAAAPGVVATGFLRLPVRGPEADDPWRERAAACVADCARRGAQLLFLQTDAGADWGVPRAKAEAQRAIREAAVLERVRAVAALRDAQAPRLKFVLDSSGDGDCAALFAAGASNYFAATSWTRIRPNGPLAGAVIWRRERGLQLGVPYLLRSFDLPVDGACSKLPSEGGILAQLVVARFASPSGASLNCAQNGATVVHGRGDVLAAEDVRWWNDRDGLFEAPELGGAATPGLLAFATAAEFLDGSSATADISVYQDGWKAVAFDTRAHGRVTLLMLHDAWQTCEPCIDDLKNRPDRAPDVDKAREMSFKATARTVTVVDRIGRRTLLAPVDGRVKLTLTEEPVLVLGIDLP